MQPERDPLETPQPTPMQPAPEQTAPQNPVRTPIVTLAPDSPTPASETVAWQNQTADAPVEGITSPQPAPADQPFRWQGTEYIHHEKDTMWFVIFGVIVVAFMAVSILLIQSITFTILIPVMAAALIVYTRRPPRLIEYTLSTKGLYVNDQLYPYAEFKGFGVIRDGQEYSIMMLPVKRFRPGISIYFPEEVGEPIVDLLGSRLPMQEMKLDFFDQIIHKLRI